MTGLLCSLCSVGRKPLGAVRCTNFALLLFSFRAMCSGNDGTWLKAHRHVQSRLAPVICLVSLSSKGCCEHPPPPPPGLLNAAVNWDRNDDDYKKMV